MPRRRAKFPVFAVIVLVVAIFWFLSELIGFSINLPWIPLIVIIITLGWIYNRMLR